METWYHIGDLATGSTQVVDVAAPELRFALRPIGEREVLRNTRAPLGPAGILQPLVRH